MVVGADFAGFPLKEVVVEHLKKKGWKILDLGVKKDSDSNDTDLMFHRVGLPFPPKNPTICGFANEIELTPYGLSECRISAFARIK